MSNSEKKLAENIKSDTKLFYAHAWNHSAVKTGVGPLRGQDGVLVTDSQETAGMLNDYFAKVFTEEDTTHAPNDPVFDTTELLPIYNDNLIDESNVMSQLIKLCTDKATGVDELSPKLL